MEEVGSKVPREEVHRQIGKGADKLIPEFVGNVIAGNMDQRYPEVYRDCAELPESGYPENVR